MTHISFFSAPWKSGAGWFNRELAEAIAGHGMEVTFISPLAEPESRETAVPGLHRLIIPGGPSRRGGLSYKISRALTKLMTAFRYIKIQSRKTDTLVYSFYDWLIICVVHFIYIKMCGFKLIFVVHDATPHAYSLPKWLRFFEIYLLRLTYRLPDKLVTLTNVARQELIDRYRISPDKVVVIPHGAFVTAFSPVPGTRQILLFGTLRRNKRIKDAILAFEKYGDRFPDLSLLIAGAIHSDDRAYWEECTALIKPSNARISTEVGFIEEDRLKAILAQSDALLLAYEDFNSQSGVAVMASFAERPIIGSKAGGIAELCEQGLSLFPITLPVSAETIADALEAFAAVPLPQLQSISRTSREHLTAHLSWARIGGLYVELINDLQRHK